MAQESCLKHHLDAAPMDTISKVPICSEGDCGHCQHHLSVLKNPA